EGGDCGLSFWRDGFYRALASGVRLHHNHLHSCESWKIFADGIREKELAFVMQHHDGDRNHRLGHGCNREDGITSHRCLGLRVTEAHRLEIGELAFTREGNYSTWDMALFAFVLERRGKALKSFG